MMQAGIGDAETAELLADAELNDQATVKATNFFVSVKEVREFVKGEVPAAAVFISAITCVVKVERLLNNPDTQVTLVDGFMAYCRRLEKKDPFRRDARVLQVTVWDPKIRSHGRPRFQTGVVYELKKIHTMKFYNDMVQGGLHSLGTANHGVIQEFAGFKMAKRARLDSPASLFNNQATDPADEDEKEEEEMMLFGLY
ncbi:hypothetical protein PF005_g7101 [Phytophthora fragariae]|uniref:Uncharacterized protein n=2 Tax=Phytophthora fragariae TaxID=53985 RepID=A0A6A4E821_9STRA|nr:hypothetical protein PF011_g6736 [Phytophthora fragariae]KAE9123109.1 hypothetical protein PF010_g6529 [Phytophthora fragariae]KAE9221472.1 hypothetical protein PF005_g7101 [Phytophthora fragariae]KAE9318025.1 hypothetical protein PF001_g6559 [Phytophthora fragariae]